MAILVVHYTLRFCVCFKLLIKIKGRFGELKGFTERIVKNSLEVPAKTHIHFLLKSFLRRVNSGKRMQSNAASCMCICAFPREKHPQLSLAAPRGRDPYPPPTKIKDLLPSRGNPV